jgi:hypothetical protein
MPSSPAIVFPSDGTRVGLGQGSESRLRFLCIEQPKLFSCRPFIDIERAGVRYTLDVGTVIVGSPYYFKMRNETSFVFLLGHVSTLTTERSCIEAGKGRPWRRFSRLIHAKMERQSLKDPIRTSLASGEQDLWPSWTVFSAHGSLPLFRNIRPSRIESSFMDRPKLLGCRPREMTNG